MTKNVVTILCAVTLSILLLFGCVSHMPPYLKGSYQSEHMDGYIVQMAFQPEDHQFVTYINNREVDEGTYEEIQKDVYEIKGDIQQFELTVHKDDSFHIFIDKLNNGDPIEMVNVDNVPIYISTPFEDVEKYKALLQ